MSLLICGDFANMSGNQNPRFPLKAYNLFLSISCTSKKSFDLVYGNILGPDLRIFQRIEAYLDQPVTFIIFSINGMKSLAMDLINRQTEGLVGRN